jgi:hypothetical protein
MIQAAKGKKDAAWCGVLSDLGCPQWRRNCRLDGIRRARVRRPNYSAQLNGTEFAKVCQIRATDLQNGGF